MYNSTKNVTQATTTEGQAWSYQKDFFLRATIFIFLYYKGCILNERIRTRKLQNKYKAEKGLLESDD